jgi:hypothetical protein
MKNKKARAKAKEKEKRIPWGKDKQKGKGNDRAMVEADLLVQGRMTNLQMRWRVGWVD